MNVNNILSKIEPHEKLGWKDFCKKYGKVVKKEVRKRLTFWEYHFTDAGIMGEYIMLNSAWTDAKKKQKAQLRRNMK